LIISRTPVRISFLGGGTDYPDVVSKWDGMVLGTTIDKYSYITCRNLPPIFDYKTRLSYSKIECVKNNNDIQHKAIKACIRYSSMMDWGLEIAHTADLPSSSGTGSSSTFIVGLLNALDALKEPNWVKRFNYYDLYKAANRIESDPEYLGEKIGYQDHAWATAGGLNLFTFRDNGSFRCYRLNMSANQLDYFERCFMLFYTGIPRIASKIASSYKTMTEQEHHKLIDLTEKGWQAIEHGRYLDLGQLIHASWEIKKDQSPNVTNEKIDIMFDAGMRAGASGGKLIGAGGGGCLLFVVEPNIRDRVQQSLQYHGAIHIPFKFSNKGSHIILNGDNYV
jgi:D-glycero-alpha-D-manno-heptose-7-phosphate kinase